MTKPLINIISCVDQKKLAPLLHGMEEEEIPFQIMHLEGNHDLCQAAYLGATQSALSVGVSMNEDRAVLHYKNLPENEPLFQISAKDPEELMKLGTNAARLVKGIPFKPLKEV